MAITLQKRRFHRTNKELRATVTYASDNWYADVEPWSSALPTIGCSYSTTYPDLICVDINVDDENVHGALVTCEFSNLGFYGEDFWSVSHDYSCEVLDTTKGMIWEDTGTSVEIPVSTIMPIDEITISGKVSTAPSSAIKSAEGKLNNATFLGYPAEQVMFEGAHTDCDIDENGNITNYIVEYKFLARQRSHNEALREAKIKLVDGMPQYYQCTDPDKPNYTTDATQDSQPVYVSGLAGQSKWTKPKDPTTNKYRYETCDLQTALGLPAGLE